MRTRVAFFSGALAACQLGLRYSLTGIEADPQHFKWMKQHFHTGGSANWYGQRIAADAPLAGARSRLRAFFDRRGDVRRVSSVRAISLRSLLRDQEIVDLVDADIQGAEGEVFPPAREEVQRGVRKVHIGTHSEEVEEQLRTFFTELGWLPIYAFRGNQNNETPYGRMLFQDGVQS